MQIDRLIRAIRERGNPSALGLDTRVEYVPAPFARIKQQLTTELAVEKVTKAVSFQYYNDMCPTGPGGKTAGKLRQTYRQYLETLK